MDESPAARWARERSFHHSSFPASLIAAERGATVSVIVPARECAATIGALVGQLTALRSAGAIDEIVVVDGASRDGTAALAAAAGATVAQESELMAELGPALGKGDAMWRALSLAAGELVCFIDADSEGEIAHYVTGLLGPLICDGDVAFVKGHYRRPFGASADGGGRVNHLTARPALATFYPELAGFRQPLAGEVAARRELLERLPFATGYGVEIAMLIDAWQAVGLAAMAQVDLGEHRNPHKPLAELVPMAETVLATLAERLRREGRFEGEPGGPLERPPLAGVGL